MPEPGISETSVKDSYWQSTFDTLYDVWYQELASESLLVRWERIDTITAFLAAITASGSAVAGWALWTQPSWKFVWVVLAGIVGVVVIIHGVLRIPSRVKAQGELHKLFLQLRVDIQTFRQQLETGLKADEAQERFSELRNRLSQCINLTHPDIAYTTGFRKNIQKELDDVLRRKKYIK